MFLHKKFNSGDSVNTWRYVSLQIALMAFWAFTKKPQKSRLKVFCLPVDRLSFCQNFERCEAIPNTTLTQTMSLCKLKYGMGRHNSTLNI